MRDNYDDCVYEEESSECRGSNMFFPVSHHRVGDTMFYINLYGERAMSRR